MGETGVLTGARARLRIGDIVVGYATGVTVRESITYEPINVIDNLHVLEHVPTGYDVSMTADLVRVIGQTLKTQGLYPKQGLSAADHLVNILTSGELTATIEARYSDGTYQAAIEVQGVRISEQNTNVTARGIVGTNVSMVARRAYDEGDIDSASP